MTSIVGIKTNTENVEAIILGTDTQMAIYQEEKVVEKRYFYKILCGEFWAIAHAGAINDELRRFYNSLRYTNKENQKKMIENAIKRRRFIEIDKLNAEYYRKEENLEQLHEFIFAINEPKLRLFHIDCFGNLRASETEKPYLVLGTGKEKIERHLEEKLEGDNLDFSNITIKTALELCRDGLKKASSMDIFSGGLDIVVLKKDKISYQFGRKLREALDNVEKQEFEKFLREQTGL